MNQDSWDDLVAISRQIVRQRLLGLAMVAIPCMGASSYAGYRIAQWRGNSDDARRVASDTSKGTRDRVHAIEGMRRDATLTLDALKSMAAEPGSVGEHAENALRHLRFRFR